MLAETQAGNGDHEKLIRSLERMQNFLEMQQLYRSAIAEITTKLEILDDEFGVRYDYNPIHHIESRLKSTPSILEKLMRKGLTVDIETAKAELSDIAGIRVICNYVEDIYRIADMLTSQDDIILVRKRDYIQSPKPNGYRSLHLIVRVPVFLSNKRELVTAEVQIRTIAQDFWASLEHHLRYKSTTAVPDELRRRLKMCADTGAALDAEMQSIFRQLKEN